MNNLVSSSLLNNIVETMLKVIVGSTMLLAHNNVVQVPISCLGILHICNLWILLRKICSGSACYATAPLHKQLVSHCISTLSSQSERALYGGHIKQSVGCRQRSRFFPVETFVSREDFLPISGFVPRTLASKTDDTALFCEKKDARFSKKEVVKHCDANYCKPLLFTR